MPPPVKAFWSVTMYKLPTPLFIANSINRYSIGDRTPGFEPTEDGSVTIYLQHESPGPEKEAKWLPAPDGPFALALRIYWPDQDVLDGTWEPSSIMKLLGMINHLNCLGLPLVLVEHLPAEGIELGCGGNQSSGIKYQKESRTMTCG